MKSNHKADHKTLKVILVGEGGQGIQTIAKVVSRAAFDKGYHASYMPNFGTEQRGGLSLAFVQVSESIIVSPKFKTADLFIIVTDRDIERTLRYIGQHTSVLFDKDLVSEATVKKIKQKSSCAVGIDAFTQATTELTERSFNVILIGILTGLIDPKLEKTVISVMDTKFAKYYKKKPELKESNKKAFNIGISLTRDQES